MSPVPIRSVKFWINAFIPEHILGYTLTVPAGPQSGKTMIPGPLATNVSLEVKRVPVSSYDFARGLSGLPHSSRDVTFFRGAVGISDCYLTDQRSFSNDIHAKSRMHSEFKLDITGQKPQLTQWHNCDWTTELDCEDGTVECLSKGAADGMSFTLKSGSSMPVVVELEGAANNPCSPASRIVGDIDYEGAITVDIGARKISLDILIDEFPAFEAYATINDGAGVELFTAEPPSGHTVMDLPGGANRQIRCSLQDTSGDGVFDKLVREGGEAGE